MNKQETPNNPPVEINLIPQVANTFGEKVLFEEPKEKFLFCHKYTWMKYGGIINNYRSDPSSHNPKI